LDATSEHSRSSLTTSRSRRTRQASSRPSPTTIKPSRAAALACYDRALAADPDDVEALKGRATALVYLDRPAEAIRCYERLSRLPRKQEIQQKGRMRS